MQQKLIIEGSLTDFNRYDKAARTNRFAAASIKKEDSEIVMYSAKSQRLQPVYAPCIIEFYWHCKNRKIDKDNIAFAKKFILDGLQSAGVLQQDNWNAIDGFADYFYVDKEKPRIEIIIKY